MRLAMGWAVLLAAAAVAAGCGGPRKGGSSDDDGGEETGAGGAGGTASSASGAGGANHPDGPQFVTFETNAPTFYDGQIAAFTAVLTDPNGLGDIVGGTLGNASGGTYGDFAPAGPPGAYRIEVSWEDVHALESIDFGYGASAMRTFVASFVDAAGHTSSRELTIELACSSGWAACSGSCIDTQNDDGNCGSCGNDCGADLCVPYSYCSAGSCVGDEPVDCSWLDGACAAGSCNSSTGDCEQQALPNGTACDDGDPCTTGDSCSAGACSGTPVMGGGVLFSEDFSDNLAGWTLGTEWQIGAATASTGHSAHNADPASDHSSTTDDGIAGVVIGGNASTSIHSTYYLTSPAVNTASVQGALTLTFYRWLNSDYTPYMQNVVEVFNGTSWVPVWQSGTSSVSDSSWTLQTFDLTSYKNSALKVRFGHSVGQSGAYTVSSWNVDDVAITAGTSTCP